MNQQGADIGTQYRSVVFYTNSDQKQEAENYIAKLEEDHEFDSEIVTEIKPLEKFFEAEEYHKNYYVSNPEKPYCRLVINPKLTKLRQKFGRLLKPNGNGFGLLGLIITIGIIACLVWGGFTLKGQKKNQAQQGQDYIKSAQDAADRETQYDQNIIDQTQNLDAPGVNYNSTRDSAKSLE